MKEVELKDANWLEDKVDRAVQVERLMGLRDMIKPPDAQGVAEIKPKIKKIQKKNKEPITTGCLPKFNLERFRTI